jgi:hypothetical protein
MRVPHSGQNSIDIHQFFGLNAIAELLKISFFRETDKNRRRYDAIDNSGKERRIHKTIKRYKTF